MQRLEQILLVPRRLNLRFASEHSSPLVPWTPHFLGIFSPSRVPRTPSSPFNENRSEAPWKFSPYRKATRVEKDKSGEYRGEAGETCGNYDFNISLFVLVEKRPIRSRLLDDCRRDLRLSSASSLYFRSRRTSFTLGYERSALDGRVLRTRDDYL